MVDKFDVPKAEAVKPEPKSPVEKKAPVPEQEKKTLVQKAEEEQAENVAKIDEKNADILSAAAESGDAAVHQLLGERVIAVQNQDVDAIEDIDKRLGGSVGK